VEDLTQILWQRIDNNFHNRKHGFVTHGTIQVMDTKCSLGSR
jgi:hypothetical protein